MSRLLEVAALSRMRRVPFLLDEQDYWRDGEHSVSRGGLSRADLLAMLRTPPYAHRNPRIWDRTAGDFVAVV